MAQPKPCDYCADDELELQEYDGDMVCPPCAVREEWHRTHGDGECEDGQALDHDYECTRDHRGEHTEARQLGAWEIATGR